MYFLANRSISKYWISKCFLLCDLFFYLLLFCCCNHKCYHFMDCVIIVASWYCCSLICAFSPIVDQFNCDKFCMLKFVLVNVFLLSQALSLKLHVHYLSHVACQLWSYKSIMIGCSAIIVLCCDSDVANTCMFCVHRWKI